MDVHLFVACVFQLEAARLFSRLLPDEEVPDVENASQPYGVDTIAQWDAYDVAAQLVVVVIGSVARSISEPPRDHPTSLQQDFVSIQPFKLTRLDISLLKIVTEAPEIGFYVLKEILSKHRSPHRILS